MTDQLLTREGQPFTGTVRVNDKAQRGHSVLRSCGRCGGAGGSDKWAHTGWTCFDCGGKGNIGRHDFVRLYTAAELDRLNAAKAKRDATRARKAAEAAAIEMTRRAAERSQVLADHADILRLMDRAAFEQGEGDEERCVSPFLSELIDQLRERARPLSPAQIEAAERAANKILAERVRAAAADFIGEVGERRDFALTLHKAVSLPDYGFGPSTLFIARTDDGSTVIYKGSNNPCEFPTEVRGEGRDRYRAYVVGGRVMVKATVKEHRRNQKTGERETVIARPKALASAA